MTNEEIKKLKEAEPFVPFDIHLADGRIIHVPHPEFVWVPPINQRTVIVADSKGVPEIINVLVVVSLKPNPVRTKVGRRRRAG